MRQVDPGYLARLLAELGDFALIVEGRKDERALKGLGLTDIIPINGKPLADLAGELDENMQIVILTDYDEKGKRLAARLAALLQRRRIRTSPRLRRMMMNTGITRIEEIAACSGAAISTKEQGDNHGEIGANFYKVYNKSEHQGQRHNRKA
jgi:5S rRNA maturation endonuclease (ribonuclease M5)